MGSEASEGSHGNARVAGTCGEAQCCRAKVVKETPLTESERVAGAHVAERALFVTSRRRKTPTGNTTRGKVKFGRRRGSHKREEENPSTRRRLRGTAAKPRKPPPPHTMCHTPHWASAGRVAFYYFVFLKRRKSIRGHFLGVFGIRSGPSQGLSGIRRGIRGHPRVRCAHVVLAGTILVCWEPHDILCQTQTTTSLDTLAHKVTTSHFHTTSPPAISPITNLMHCFDFQWATM